MKKNQHASQAAQALCHKATVTYRDCLKGEVDGVIEARVRARPEESGCCLHVSSVVANNTETAGRGGVRVGRRPFDVVLLQRRAHHLRLDGGGLLVVASRHKVQRTALDLYPVVTQGEPQCNNALEATGVTTLVPTIDHKHKRPTGQLGRNLGVPLCTCEREHNGAHVR